MPQSTNLNVTPYYDDFQSSKDFYRVLFRPGYSIQSRELTTLQSVLQNQVESVGKYLMKEGSMVVPGEISFNNQYSYIKISSYSQGFTLSQFLGAIFGSWLAYVIYIDHYRLTKDEETVRGSFCTGPAIRNYKNNFFSELMGTFVLVFAIFFIVKPNIEIEGEVINFGLGSLDALPVGIVVWVIGMTLGGTTGFAINPARDFGPRLMYSLLPRKNKKPDWSYSWIPVLGPIVGAILAGIIFNILL